MNSITQKLRMMDEEWRLYTLRHLPTQCINAGDLKRVHQLLTSFDFIETKIGTLQSEDGINQVLADYTSAITANADTHGILASLATAIRLSATILTKDAMQTFPQIYGRLLNESNPSLRTLLDNYTPSSPWLRIQSKTMFPTESALVRTLVGPDAEVLDCAISKDARIILSASSDHTLRIWNMESGICEHILQGHTDAVNSCALSTDGKWALSASTDKTLRLWDTRTGQCLRVFEGHTGKVTDCALSHDSTFFLSSSYDQTVRLWDIQTQMCVILHGHEERVTCCALSSDGRFALSGSYDKTLRLWSVATHKCLRIIHDDFGGITHCILSHNGRLALSTSIAYLLEWENYDSNNGLIPLSLFYNPEEKGESDLKTEPEDHFFYDTVQVITNSGITSEIINKDRIISFWNLFSKERIYELTEHQSCVSDLNLSVDGRWLISSSDAGDLKIWDMDSGEYLPASFEAIGGISSCAIDRTGNTAISSTYYGSLHIWSIPIALRNAQLIATKPSGEAIHCCRYNQKGDRALSISSSREIQQWDTQTGDLVSQLTIAEFPTIAEIDVSVDRQIAIVTPSFAGLTSQETKELKIFDIQTGEQLQTLSGHTGRIEDCAIDQQGTIALSAADDGTLRIWELEAYTCRFTLEGHEDAVTCCALSADGLKALSGSDDTTLRVWDTQTGQCLHILRGHSASIKSCTFSADGQRGLSISSDNMLCLWNLSSGTLLHKHMSDSELSGPCALNPDGQLALYVTSQRTIHLFDTENGKKIIGLTFDNNIISVAFSPRGTDIIAGGSAEFTHFLHYEEMFH